MEQSKYNDLIKVVRISNASQWDGVEMRNADFNKLLDVLRLSKLQHMVVYIGLDYESYKVFI